MKMNLKKNLTYLLLHFYFVLKYALDLFLFCFFVRFTREEQTVLLICRGKEYFSITVSWKFSCSEANCSTHSSI